MQLFQSNDLEYRDNWLLTRGTFMCVMECEEIIIVYIATVIGREGGRERERERETLYVALA